MTKPFRYAITPRGEVRLEMNDTTFFLSRRRAAELLRTINAAVREQGADSGPTAPNPEIIRTREELAALDPDTLLIDADDPWYDVRLCAHEWMEDYTIETEGFFPLAVIATGDTVRAAQQALDGIE